MNEMVESGFSSGASTLVIKDGVEIYYGEAGYADISGKIPHKRDSIFRLYSMSKPITGATAMAAMEDGLLDVNLPVKDFIPSFANQKFEENGELKPVYRDAKVKDLLNMTAGLSYGGDWNLKASVESIERFKDLELSAICFPNLGLLTGQLVRNHLQNIIVNYADLEKECARTDITNEDKISSLKKSFYSCLSRDPLVHKTMERTFKAILKQLALE